MTLFLACTERQKTYDPLICKVFGYDRNVTKYMCMDNLVKVVQIIIFFIHFRNNV